MSLEVHKIKEIHPGVFWMLLDFPTSRLLRFILSDDYRYVWCHNHRVGNYSWREYRLPLFLDKDAHNVASRLVLFDFIIPTEKFKEILPKLDVGVHVIQLNEMPPDYFDLDKIKGKERYDLLAKSDWLFEFDVPGNDYGQIASSKEELLQSILRNPAIDPMICLEWFHQHAHNSRSSGRAQRSVNEMVLSARPLIVSLGRKSAPGFSIWRNSI